MYINARRLDDGFVSSSDVCVIGAGAAGITLSLGLASKGIDVALIESGGLEADTASDDLYQGETIGLPYTGGNLGRSRLRFFGGTTNHWGGLCRPLDDWDFASHPWIPDSGWPITRRSLDAFYGAAQSILDIPTPYPSRFEDWETNSKTYPRLFGKDNPSFEPLLWLRSPPVRFGWKYRMTIKRSSRIRCYLNANALEVVPEATGSAITHVTAATLSGLHLRFRARHFVLATGGIENARILLLSNSVLPRGVGNQYDVVGRYFQDHLYSLEEARMLVTPPAGAQGFQEERVRKWAEDAGRGVDSQFSGFATTASLREKNRLGAFGTMVTPAKLEADLPDGLRELIAGTSDSTSPSSEDRPTRSFRIFQISEHTPNRASRISLGKEKDALGQRRVAVDIHIREEDRRSYEYSVGVLASELTRLGRGRLHLTGNPIFPSPFFGGHHMGATRMSDDSKRGVTNPDCRVHGVQNLHIAGSSVFPTSGFSNPTMTIIALTLRLSDKLEKANLSPMPEARG